MLNLTQRLVLGCVVITALTIGLVAVTHRALASAGETSVALAFVFSIVLAEIATVLIVLQPIKRLAGDVKKIATGNLEHRVTLNGRDDFGVVAAEINRIAVRLRDLRESEAGRRQMEFQLSD